MNGKISTIIKYIFALLLPLCAVVFRNMSWNYFVTAMASVLAIAIVTNSLCQIKTWIAYIFNSCALFLINAQYAILFWSNTFVTSVMLNNLDSVEALGGKAVQYGITTVLVFALSLLPVCHITVGKKRMVSAGLACLALYGIVCWQGMYAQWPNYAMYELLSQQIRRHQIAAEIKGTMGSENEFYKESVADYIPKPDNLPDLPNVILVFTEGLSQHIVEDERNIMSNVKALSEKSIVFDNYFNHTFATYMGLSGQLYSGYQKKTFDQNHLTSLQDVFKFYGYDTTFINTEPINPEFTEYLGRFYFDNLTTDMNRLDSKNGDMSDKSAYELLWETALEKSEAGKPFFISMYTFGTHVSFDSVYEKFGDGQDPFLNRFYDLDVQLGVFLEAFESSPLFENTVFVFTTDHATYCDSDFVHAYPNYKRTAMSLDRIPFYIYYNGVEPAVYDVNGRNSLDMAPTVLDYLDMTMGNSFLGESLFSPYDNASVCDTIYESSGNILSSADGKIQGINADERQTVEFLLAKYFAVKMNDSTAMEGFYDQLRAYAQFDAKSFTLGITLTNAGNWDKYAYAIWSEENEQDDLNWYWGDSRKNSDQQTTIELVGHDSSGLYYVHVYGYNGTESEFVAETTFYIDPEVQKNRPHLNVALDEEKKSLHTELDNVSEWRILSYAVWSEADGQDDLNWFQTEKQSDTEFLFDIDLSAYDTLGKYYVHAYGIRDGSMTKVAGTTFVRE